MIVSAVGPNIEFCPDDIEARVASSILNAYVRWKPAEFSLNGVPVAPSNGPTIPEANIQVDGDPQRITYVAHDDEEGFAVCSFDILATSTNGNIYEYFQFSS